MLSPSAALMPTTSAGIFDTIKETKKSPKVMDTVYPEPLSRLYRRAIPKKKHRGVPSRYRTQPITFAEIQEIDEENIDESNECSVAVSSKSEIDIKLKFDEFLQKSKLDNINDNSTAEELSDDCQSLIDSSKSTVSSNSNSHLPFFNNLRNLVNKPLLHKK